MSRTLMTLWGLLAILVSAAVARSSDDDTILGKTGPEWIKVLAESKEPRHRRAAVLVLSMFGAKARGVVPALSEALRRDADPEIREAAAQALGGMGEEAKSAIPDLGEAVVRDKSELVREAAAKALGGRMAVHAKVVLPTLVEALKDPHQGTQAAVAQALKDQGAEARGAMRQLLDVVKDPKADRFARGYAIQIVSRFEGESATVVPVLLVPLREKGAAVNVRKDAAEGLARFEKDGVEGAAALAEVLQDKAAPATLRRRLCRGAGAGRRRRENRLACGQEYTDRPGYRRALPGGAAGRGAGQGGSRGGPGSGGPYPRRERGRVAWRRFRNWASLAQPRRRRSLC